MKADGSGGEIRADYLVFVLHSEVICICCSVIANGSTSVIQTRDCSANPAVLWLLYAFGIVSASSRVSDYGSLYE